jgi:succinoglycan biosynthesis transport protein ExoP
LRHDNLNPGLAFADYVRVLRRRKWIVVGIAVLVPLVAVLVSLRQAPTYRASAEVLVNQENLAAILSGVEDPGVWRDPVRFMQTQVDVAQTPGVTRRVSETTGIALEALPRPVVAARENSNILEFTVTHRDPAVAASVATAYAEQFIGHRYELDTAALERAREEIGQRMREVRKDSGPDSSFYKKLRETEQQLRTMEALQTSNASLARPARSVQIAPRPVRNGVLALGLGLVLAVALAFLREALDTRLRSAAEIGERLGLPLLARLPEPPRSLQRDKKLVMVAQPSGLMGEAFRMLRTNLAFVALSRGAPVSQPPVYHARAEHAGSPQPNGADAPASNPEAPSGGRSAATGNGRPMARSIMVTSAVEKEGKSTTIANLAVALVRAGRHVVLVDLDLRRPLLHQFFGLEPRPGVTDVALGEVELEDALTAMTPDPVSEGLLEVLTSGSVPPDAGEFVGTPALMAILDELRRRADIVLVDAPPMLQLGDAMTLSASLDGLIVVTRLGVVTRPMLTEVQRVLKACPAEKLGFVVTAANVEKGEGYGYGYGYGYEDGYVEPRQDALVRVQARR